MAPRKTPLTMSQPPATVRNSSTSHTSPTLPAAAMARPQSAAESTTIRPWWWTREVQPLVRLTSRAPRGTLAYISPSDHRAFSSSARNGSRASGIARNIAARSTA